MLCVTSIIFLLKVLKATIQAIFFLKGHNNGYLWLSNHSTEDFLINYINLIKYKSGFREAILVQTRFVHNNYNIEQIIALQY